MKWVLSFVLIAVIMTIAFAFSRQYNDKFDFYNNLKTFLEQFKINLSFRQDKIIDFLNSKKPQKQFKAFIEDYKEYLTTGNLNFNNINLLEEEEKIELQDIINNLGSMDFQNEIDQLNTFQFSIDQKLKQAEQNKQKVSPMIIKLSLLFALAIVIILI